MAVAVVSVAHRKGIEIPTQLSVTGFDDAPLAVKIWPRLTTIRQPVMAMAERAIGMAVTLARDPDAAETGIGSGTTYFSFDLVERESASPPKE
jgi:LacI family transcriptional regulator